MYKCSKSLTVRKFIARKVGVLRSGLFACFSEFNSSVLEPVLNRLRIKLHHVSKFHSQMSVGVFCSLEDFFKVVELERVELGPTVPG